MINQSQVEDAQEKLRAVQQYSIRIEAILARTTDVILADEEDGKALVSLTTSQKDKLFSEYAKAKTALSNAVNQLP